ncbi:unnamed protein product [Euphydryas editha]|uniref:Uncharacterized protein n=1 Tax=Euphydryas editha TaxID=104508 RepID=A0AAU9UWA5_EUPED|nr:unnamed protein product [Euphydryas editha]
MEYNTENHRQFYLFCKNEPESKDEIVVDNSNTTERRRQSTIKPHLSQDRYRSSSSPSETPLKVLKKKTLGFFSCLNCCKNNTTINKQPKDHKKNTGKRVHFDNLTKCSKGKSAKLYVSSSATKNEGSLEDKYFSEIELKDFEESKDPKKKGKLTTGIPVKGKKNSLNLETKHGRERKSHSHDSTSLVSLFQKITHYKGRNLKKYGYVHHFRDSHERKTCYEYIRNSDNSISKSYKV